MKKFFSLTTVVLLSVCLVSSCSSNNTIEEASSTTTITGKITDITDNTITIKVLTGLHVESAVIIIEDATEYAKEVDKNFAKDNIVVFEVTKKTTDKNTVNFIAKKIISNKPI